MDPSLLFAGGVDLTVSKQSNYATGSDLYTSGF